MPVDVQKLGQYLMGEWDKTKQPLKERASVLPLGQYEDGSVGMAWPGLLAAPAEGVANFGSRGYGEEAVPYNSRMAFDAAGGAMTGGFGVGMAGGMVDNALGSAGAKLTKSASDLPMDLASRMARAREMGFDTENPVYHGSQYQNIEAFDLGKANEGWRGSAVHTSTDPKMAALYGADGRDYPGMIYPLMTRAKKFADYNETRIPPEALSPEQLAKVKSEWGSTIDSDGLRVAYVMDALGGNNTNELLKALGYEGLQEGSHKAVFDPKDLRSTVAAFDPSQSDSANLLAANAKSGASVPLAIDAAERSPAKPHHAIADIQSRIVDAEKTSAELRELSNAETARGNLQSAENLANKAAAAQKQATLAKADLRKAIRGGAATANAPTGASIPAGMQASQDQDTDPALLEYLRSVGLY